MVIIASLGNVRFNSPWEFACAVKSRVAGSGQRQFDHGGFVDARRV